MIRKAAVDDIPLIMKMAGIVFPHTYRDILSAAQIEYMMDMMYSERSLRRQFIDDGQIFFLSEGEGYASLRPAGRLAGGRKLFHLEKLYVMPEAQGVGLGRRLFDAVLTEAEQLSGGHLRLELNVNRNNTAVTFYEHLGMRRDRQGDFPIGHGYFMNDYIMVIEIG